MGVAVCCGLLLFTGVQATVIAYRATDLVDVVPGEDRWQYEYLVSGFAFPQFFGFDIFFPVADGFLFGDLQDPPPTPNADWATLTIQADPLLPADGFYEAVALVDNASLADFFTVEFTWRGAGVPGSQIFELFDDSFQVIERGETIPLTPIPEPSALLLVGIGLFALRARGAGKNITLRCGTRPTILGR
jgi:hypothetical protein